MICPPDENQVGHYGRVQEQDANPDRGWLADDLQNFQREIRAA